MPRAAVATAAMLKCTLCGHIIRDRIYVTVTVPTSSGTRQEPRHLACDVRLRRIFMQELTPTEGDGAYIHRRILPQI